MTMFRAESKWYKIETEDLTTYIDLDKVVQIEVEKHVNTNGQQKIRFYYSENDYCTWCLDNNELVNLHILMGV